jgi:hypothetical protein
MRERVGGPARTKNGGKPDRRTDGDSGSYCRATGHSQRRTHVRPPRDHPPEADACPIRRAWRPARAERWRRRGFSVRSKALEATASRSGRRRRTATWRFLDSIRAARARADAFSSDRTWRRPASAPGPVPPLQRPRRAPATASAFRAPSRRKPARGHPHPRVRSATCALLTATGPPGVTSQLVVQVIGLLGDDHARKSHRAMVGEAVHDTPHTLNDLVGIVAACHPSPPARPLVPADPGDLGMAPAAPGAAEPPPPSDHRATATKRPPPSDRRRAIAADCPPSAAATAVHGLEPRRRALLTAPEPPMPDVANFSSPSRHVRRRLGGGSPSAGRFSSPRVRAFG